MKALSHLDERGAARMVSVADKTDTDRVAVASARVRMRPEVTALIGDGAAPKGDVLAVARVAGIMAAKRTAELIPLCHPVRLDAVAISFTLGEGVVSIRAEVTCRGPTGVEMEALTAASVAALTIYDMCKSVDREMVVERVLLEHKRGGRSGDFDRAPEGGGSP
jgi:cyclic pyranopterin phosphate synthase